MPYVQSERSIFYFLHRSASSRGLQAQGERELVPGLDEVSCGLLETLLSGGWDVYVCELPCVLPISPFFLLLPSELSLAVSFYNRKEGARST